MKKWLIPVIVVVVIAVAVGGVLWRSGGGAAAAPRRSSRRWRALQNATPAERQQAFRGGERCTAPGSLAVVAAGQGERRGRGRR